VDLFAPKPWLIASTEEDFFTLPGAKQVFDEAQGWYKLHDAADRVRWVVGRGGHGTPLRVREAIYEWMIRWLAPGTASATEEAVTLLPDHDLLVTPKGQVAGRELYQIIAETPRQKGSAAELEGFVRTLVERNPALVRANVIPAAGKGKHPAVVLVQNTLAATSEERQLEREGYIVARVRLSGTGDDPERPRSGNWMNNTRAWLVGRNLPAMHASEINVVVNQLARHADVDATRISARASGVAGIPLLLAAAVNPQLSAITLYRTPHSVRAAIEAPIHTNLHDAVIPGFAVKWDLADVRALIRPRPVMWQDPTDWMGNVVALKDGFVYLSSDPNAAR
jgi:hypothetical protein